MGIHDIMKLLKYIIFLIRGYKKTLIYIKLINERSNTFNHVILGYQKIYHNNYIQTVIISFSKNNYL